MYALYLKLFTALLVVGRGAFNRGGMPVVCPNHCHGSDLLPLFSPHRCTMEATTCFDDVWYQATPQNGRGS